MICQIILTSIVVFFASMVSTICGFGMSSISVPLFMLFLPTPQTLLFSGIAHIIGSLWILWFFRAGMSSRLLISFGLPSFVLSICGAYLAMQLPEIVHVRWFGGFLMIYSIVLFVRPALHLPQTWPVEALGGAVTGAFAGFFGLGGAFRSAMLITYQLPKIVYIFTSHALELCIDGARSGTYVLSGTQLSLALWIGVLLSFPLSLAGVLLGKWVTQRISSKHFKRVVIAGLFLAGLRYLFIS